MKQQLLRVSLLVLSLALCFGLFACADPGDDTGDQGQNNQTPGENPGEDGTPQILPDVELMDYDYTLNALHYTVEGQHEAYCPWNEICPAIGVTGPIGDIIEDDVFDRTGWLEETYGIQLTNEYLSYLEIPTRVQNLIKGGSDEYQLLLNFGFAAQHVMGRNYFHDWSEVPNVDLNKPWWVKESIETLKIGEFVEFVASDMLILDKGATSLVFFNIGMAEELGFTDLYELADEGDWTMEVLAECAEDAYRDDGNDERDEKDTFGIINGDDPVLNLYIGAGMKFIDRTEDGEYFYSYGTDPETLDVMTDILSNIMYEDFFWNGWLTRDQVAAQPSFKKGQALFNFSMAKGCNSFRDMKDDYGVLPIPKYDEYQKQYYSQVHSYHDSMMAILNTVPESDLGKVGAAIEVLSYYSYYNIYSDFYEVVIQGRGTRDEESREMLDTIFSTRTYDMGLVYDPTGFSDEVLRYTAKGDTNLTSFIKTHQDKLTGAMQDLNDLAESYW